MAHFQAGVGLKRNGLTEAVGTRVLCRYRDPESDDDGDEKCCIIIPSFHPGAGRPDLYDIQAFFAIFLKTVAIAWLAMDIAINTTPLSTTAATCVEIMRQLDEKVGLHTDYWKKFCAQKAQLGVGRLGKRRLAGAMGDEAGYKSVRSKPPARDAKAPVQKFKDQSWAQYEAHTGFGGFGYDLESDEVKIYSESERWHRSKTQAVSSYDFDHCLTDFLHRNW